MYTRVFTWVETRAKSELRVRLVPVKHVEALQCFFLLAQISSIVFLNVKKPAFTPYSGVCVCVLVVVVGGGMGQVYHDPAIAYSITCVDRRWLVRQWLQMHAC